MYNFAPRANDVLSRAQMLAKQSNNKYVGTLHLLSALLSGSNSTGAEMLIDQGVVNVDEIVKELKKLISVDSKRRGRSKQNDIRVPLSDNINRALNLADQIAKKFSHPFIGTEHLLMAIVCMTSCRAFDFLYQVGVDLPQFAQSLKEYLNPESTDKTIDKNKNDAQRPPEENSGKGLEQEQILQPGEALQLYSVELTQLALEDGLDPVYNRENEIERMMQILCRRTKNNPVLLGDPGVGKTAVVEGLAQIIASGDVPLQLKDKKIYSIDIALMVAGTKFRGQFEERMKAVIDDLMMTDNSIAFIDELHMLVGAGNADGAMDAANILKPALTKGKLCCIGATTYDEYREYIESDAALERRFQTVDVKEPDERETLEIIQGLKHKYESFHKVKYTEQAIQDIVTLSGRYITDRFYPDKAIDVMDEAASRVRLAKNTISKPIKNIEQKIQDCINEKQTFIDQDDYIKAATYRAAEKRFIDKKDKMIKRVLNTQRPITINATHIRETVSKWCGVPLEQLAGDEKKKLLKLQTTLNDNVKGQTKAIELICDSIIRSRVDVGDPNKPVGSFMCLGPTGVGKTFLAKQLALHVFGDEESMIRLDMSEMMESHSVSKMIGSPPGYVGYGEGGQLTEQVRRNPYSIVLFDEVEKAHPEVMQLLLQLLDEGQLTDSQGVTVNFKNCIILMTSNIGAEKLQKCNVLGFMNRQDESIDQVKQELKSFYRPEFINRIDEIIIFNALDKSICKDILNNELKQFTGRLESKNKLKLRIQPKVKQFLLDNGFDDQYGARPLRRVIQNKLQTPLAKFILANDKLDGDVVVKMDGSKICFHKKTPA